MKISTITLSGLALFAGLSLMSCNSDKATGAAESAANEAMDKAGDMAGKAGDMADDAKNMAGDMADKAGNMAGDAKDMAGDMAGKAGDKMANAAEGAAGAMDKVGNKMSEVASNTAGKVRYGVRDVNFKPNDMTSGLYEKMVAANSNLDVRMKVLEEKMSGTAAVGAGKAEMQKQYDILKEMGDKLQASFDKLATVEDGDWKKFERKTKVMLKTIDPTL